MRSSSSISSSNKLGKPLLIKLAVFALLPLVIGELAARRLSAPFWFDQVAQRATGASIDFMFVGSSRVAHSIDEAVFAQQMGARLGRPVVALNMGRGYSTMAQYYLGLRKIAQRNPRALQGCVVMLEAPGGLPAAERWTDRWGWRQIPQYLVPYLEAADLRRLWRESPMAIDEKLYLTLATYSALAHKLPGLKLRILSRGEDFSADMLTRLGLFEPPANDLAAAGGTRTDAAGIAAARRAALRVWAEQLHNQEPIRHWEQRICKDLVALMVEAGGRVDFFLPPMSPPQQLPYQTALRQADVAAFAEQAAAWGVAIVDVPFPTTDDDFPDGWHLRQSQAAPYTQALVASYLNARSRQRLNP